MHALLIFALYNQAATQLTVTADSDQTPPDEDDEEVPKLLCSLGTLSDTQGSASTTFNGDAGQYELELAAFDENDGLTAGL